MTEPVACTLDGTDLKSQEERWRTLAANFGLSRTPTSDGLQLTFRDHPDVAEELRALVTVENECCRWATWEVERGADGSFVMVVRSEGDGVATLHAMFSEREFRS